MAQDVLQSGNPGIYINETRGPIRSVLSYSKVFRTRELIFFLMNEVDSTTLPVQFNHKPEEPLRTCDSSLDPHGHPYTVGERCYGILWLLKPVAAHERPPYCHVKCEALLRICLPVPRRGTLSVG